MYCSGRVREGRVLISFVGGEDFLFRGVECKVRFR